MGAFGVMLQSRFGCYNLNNYKTQKSVIIKNIEIDKQKLIDCVNCFETAHIKQITLQRINILKSIDEQNYFLTILYRRKFNKWRQLFIEQIIL